jgi:hypothetical protein
MPTLINDQSDTRPGMTFLMFLINERPKDMDFKPLNLEPEATGLVGKLGQYLVTVGEEVIAAFNATDRSFLMLHNDGYEDLFWRLAFKFEASGFPVIKATIKVMHAPYRR